MKKVSCILSGLLFLFVHTHLKADFPVYLASTTTTNAAVLNNNQMTASLYPLTVTVSNYPTRTVGALPVVVLFALGNLQDTDVLLEGPQGQTCMLFSDTGNDDTFLGIFLFQDDPILSFLPTPAIGQEGMAAFYITNGVNSVIPFSAFGLPGNGDVLIVRPTDGSFGPDTFPAPAPAGPYPTSTEVFRNINPNGEWKLYISSPVPVANADAKSINWGPFLILKSLNEYDGDTNDLNPDYVLRKGKNVYVVTNILEAITKDTTPTLKVKGQVVGGADLDGDQFSELIVKKGSKLEGLKGPAFTASTHTFTVKGGLKYAASGDYNGDLIPDIYFQKKTSLYVSTNTGTGFSEPFIVADKTLPKKFKVYAALSGRNEPAVIAEGKTNIVYLGGPTFSTPIQLAGKSNPKVKAVGAGQFGFDASGSTLFFQQEEAVFVIPLDPRLYAIPASTNLPPGQSTAIQLNELKGLKYVAPR